MKITDDMLTDERLIELAIFHKILGIDGNGDATRSYGGRDDVLNLCRAVASAARRTTPDREAIRDAAFEQCAQLVDRMAKQKHDRGADDALVRSIAARIRALKTAPTSDKGGA